MRIEFGGFEGDKDWITYSVRLLGMADEHLEILLGDKALESGVKRIGRLQDDHLLPIRATAPEDRLCTREDGVQQVFLTAPFGVESTISDLVVRRVTMIDEELPGTSIEDGEEFDICLVRLSRVAVHDDVNGRADIRSDEFGITAEKGNNCFFGDIVWNLKWVSNVLVSGDPRQQS